MATIEERRLSRIWQILLLGGLMASLAGCSDALDAEAFPTTVFRGHLRLDGRGIGPGWLEILPYGGTLGVLRSAPLTADGSFEVDGVPVGKVAIRLAGRPLPGRGDPFIDRFLFKARREPVIRLTTVADSSPIEIDLREQKLAFERIYGTNY
jgi:hypothetical protein